MSVVFHSNSKLIVEYGIDINNLPKRWTFHKVINKKTNSSYWICNLRYNKQKFWIYLSLKDLVNTNRIINKIHSFIVKNKIGVSIPSQSLNNEVPEEENIENDKNIINDDENNLNNDKDYILNIEDEKKNKNKFDKYFNLPL